MHKSTATALLVLFLCISTRLAAQNNNQPLLREVTGPGNAFTLEIPDHWVTDTPAADLYEFYEDAPETGTLRAAFMNAQGSESSETIESWSADIAAQKHGRLSTTQSGDRMVEYLTEAPEGSVTLQLYNFLVFHQDADYRMRLASLHWSIDKQFAHIPINEADLILVRNIAARLRFN